MSDELLDVNNICRYYRALNVLEPKLDNFLFFKLMYLLRRRGFLLTFILQKGGERNPVINLASGIAGSYCGRAYGEYKLLIEHVKCTCKHVKYHFVSDQYSIAKLGEIEFIGSL